MQRRALSQDSLAPKPVWFPLYHASFIFTKQNCSRERRRLSFTILGPYQLENVLLIISGLEMAVSQRTFIPELFTVSDTTFCHFSGTWELSLICCVLLSLYEIVAKLFSPSEMPLRFVLTVHFYYYCCESKAL